MPAMLNKGPQRSVMPAGSTSPGGPPGASTTKSPPSQPRVQPINNPSGTSSSLATAYNSKRPQFQLRSNPTRPTGYQRPGRERAMSVSDRRALLKLNFLIIGGGEFQDANFVAFIQALISEEINNCSLLIRICRYCRPCMRI
jgi:hypothetical protein